MLCIGSNKHYTLGFPEDDFFKQPKLNPFSQNVKSISNSSFHTAIITQNGELFVSGMNNFGQLGNEQDYYIKKFTKIDIPEKCKDVCTGAEYTIVLTENNNIYVAGNNNVGQLGTCKFSKCKNFCKIESFTQDKIVMLASGSYHVMALTDTGKLFSTGNNANGRLGIFGISYQYEFKEVDLSHLGESFVSYVACGSNTTIILTDKNRIYGCGLNLYGELGLKLTYVEKFTLIPLDLNYNVKKIYCGKNHTMILDEGNNLYSSGLNDKGQLGLGHTNKIYKFTIVPFNKNISEVSLSYNHSIILTLNGEVFYSGSEVWDDYIFSINRTCNFKKLPFCENAVSAFAGRSSIFISTEDTEDTDDMEID